jgi:hypothetical protein
VIRHDTDRHTWKISDEDFLEWGELVSYTDDFKSIVTGKVLPVSPPDNKQENAPILHIRIEI